MDRDFGYNIENGGERTKMSEETKKKISQAYNGHADGNKYALGHKHTEETRNQIAKSHTGVKTGPLSEQHKSKISESKKGYQCSNEAREKMSKSGKGRVFSEEHKRKIAESNKSEATKLKMIETRRRNREAKLALVNPS